MVYTGKDISRLFGFGTVIVFTVVCSHMNGFDIFDLVRSFLDITSAFTG